MTAFKEKYDEASTAGLSWVKAEEKAILIDDAVPLTVTAAGHSVTQYGPRYFIVFDLEGETRALGFNEGSVESRDRMLGALVEFLAEEDAEPPTFLLQKVGRSIVLKDVS
jgi:hypothetical protein